MRDEGGTADGADDDDVPTAPLLPPDDRLWRHPSEVGANPITHPVAAARALANRPPEANIWVVGLLSGVIGALLATSLIALAGPRDRTVTVTAVERLVTPAGVTGAASTPSADVVGIAERIRPAIVQVVIEDESGDEGSGSGVIFRSDGMVLTNNHVIAGAERIEVLLADGREVRAELVGGDPETDIAVIRLSDARDLATAPLGSTSDLKVGQLAIAIGSPLGLAGGPSVSVGVISALGREVVGTDGPPLRDMIQTDAPITQGSSGGALLDRYGSVIGITTAIAVSEVGAEGLGFATPIDVARHVAGQLVDKGRVDHVYLGIQGEDLDQATAAKLAVKGGALVREVVEGSPADKAGLVPRDVITAVDGKPVSGFGALIVLLRTRAPGDEVEVTIVRDGRSLTKRATLAEKPGGQ